MYFHKVSRECGSMNPKTIFPTDLYFYFWHAMSSFLLCLQQAAVSKHSSICRLYLNVCLCGLWFVNNHSNVLPLKRLPSLMTECFCDYFHEVIKLLAMWTIVSIVLQFYSCIKSKEILTLILKGTYTRIFFTALWHQATWVSTTEWRNGKGWIVQP